MPILSTQLAVGRQLRPAAPTMMIKWPEWEAKNASKPHKVPKHSKRQSLKPARLRDDEEDAPAPKRRRHFKSKAKRAPDSSSKPAEPAEKAAPAAAVSKPVVPPPPSTAPDPSSAAATTSANSTATARDANLEAVVVKGAAPPGHTMVAVPKHWIPFLHAAGDCAEKHARLTGRWDEAPVDHRTTSVANVNRRVLADVPPFFKADLTKQWLAHLPTPDARDRARAGIAFVMDAAVSSPQVPIVGLLNAHLQRVREKIRAALPRRNSSTAEAGSKRRVLIVEHGWIVELVERALAAAGFEPTDVGFKTSNAAVLQQLLSRGADAKVLAALQRVVFFDPKINDPRRIPVEKLDQALDEVRSKYESVAHTIRPQKPGQADKLEGVVKTMTALPSKKSKAAVLTDLSMNRTLASLAFGPNPGAAATIKEIFTIVASDANPLVITIKVDKLTHMTNLTYDFRVQREHRSDGSLPFEVANLGLV